MNNNPNSKATPTMGYTFGEGFQNPIQHYFEKLNMVCKKAIYDKLQEYKQTDKFYWSIFGIFHEFSSVGLKVNTSLGYVKFDAPGSHLAYFSFEDYVSNIINKAVHAGSIYAETCSLNHDWLKRQTGEELYDLMQFLSYAPATSSLQIKRAVDSNVDYFAMSYYCQSRMFCIDPNESLENLEPSDSDYETKSSIKSMQEVFIRFLNDLNDDEYEKYILDLKKATDPKAKVIVI